MFQRILLVTALLATTLLAPRSDLEAAGPSASEWSIGPIIRGRNYSVNMPTTMFETKDGPAFDFPYPSASNGHVHYVTVPVRSLKGAKRISLTYRIDARPGTQFVQQEKRKGPATLSLYFQRAGDRWTRRTPHHRWYSPGARVVALQPGTFTVSISLDEPWIAMMGGHAHSLPRAYQKALNQTAKVGFTFGGNGGRGHGVFATAPARFTVLDYRID